VYNKTAVVTRCSHTKTVEQPRRWGREQQRLFILLNATFLCICSQLGRTEGLRLLFFLYLCIWILFAFLLTGRSPTRESTILFLNKNFIFFFVNLLLLVVIVVVVFSSECCKKERGRGNEGRSKIRLRPFHQRHRTVLRMWLFVFARRGAATLARRPNPMMTSLAPLCANNFRICLHKQAVCACDFVIWRKVAETWLGDQRIFRDRWARKNVLVSAYRFGIEFWIKSWMTYLYSFAHLRFFFSSRTSRNVCHCKCLIALNTHCQQPTYLSLSLSFPLPGYQIQPGCLSLPRCIQTLFSCTMPFIFFTILVCVSCRKCRYIYVYAYYALVSLQRSWEIKKELKKQLGESFAWTEVVDLSLSLSRPFFSFFMPSSLAHERHAERPRKWSSEFDYESGAHAGSGVGGDVTVSKPRAPG